MNSRWGTVYIVYVRSCWLFPEILRCELKRRSVSLSVWLTCQWLCVVTLYTFESAWGHLRWFYKHGTWLSLFNEYFLSGHKQIKTPQVFLCKAENCPFLFEEKVLPLPQRTATQCDWLLIVAMIVWANFHNDAGTNRRKQTFDSPGKTLTASHFICLFLCSWWAALLLPLYLLSGDSAYIR